MRSELGSGGKEDSAVCAELSVQAVDAQEHVRGAAEGERDGH